MCIVTVCCPVCDVINFEISLSLLIKPFSYMTKNSEQMCKYLKSEKSFQDEIKSIFLSFGKAIQLTEMVSHRRVDL